MQDVINCSVILDNAPTCFNRFKMPSFVEYKLKEYYRLNMFSESACIMLTLFYWCSQLPPPIDDIQMLITE